MLKRLCIENYVLIDHLDISFPGDLVIITGETGAGKSMLIGALSLLLGSKADVSALKDKSRNCVVEAEFEGGSTHVVRRVLNPSGRSRSFVDDEPVSLDELKALSSTLVDIHSQHQQLLLSDRGFQLSALDGFARDSYSLDGYEAMYDEYVAQSRRLSALKAQVSEDAKNREYLEFQLEKLKEAGLSDGELQALEQERAELANSEQISDGIARATASLNGGETSIDASLKNAAATLARLSEFIPEFAGYAERIETSRIEIKDVAGDVAVRGGRVQFSPERLAEVEDRISLLRSLMRRHSVESVGELIEIRDSLAGRIESGVDMELECSRLEQKCRGLKAGCEAEAGRIHDLRVKAAAEFSAMLQDRIRSLEMPFALFSVDVEYREDLTRDGRDDIVFRFNANGGQLCELSKAASGGEMSRVMLCLKSVVAGYVGMPTIIFDEIDTGVSGSIADKMGGMIVETGRMMQVFAITHLPQVASKGSAHYLVYKEFDNNGAATTQIRRIEGEERVSEIARMLSGSRLSAEALANARVLLEDKN